MAVLKTTKTLKFSAVNLSAFTVILSIMCRHFRRVFLYSLNYVIHISAIKYFHETRELHTNHEHFCHETFLTVALIKVAQNSSYVASIMPPIASH